LTEPEQDFDQKSSSATFFEPEVSAIFASGFFDIFTHKKSLSFLL